MAELTTDSEKATQSIKPFEIAARSDGAGRNILATALIVLVVAVCLFFVWEMSSSLRIIFAGILFTSFLDAFARAFGSIIFVERVWRLTMVILILTVPLVLGIIWGAGKISDQARVLLRVMDAQDPYLATTLAVHWS